MGSLVLDNFNFGINTITSGEMKEDRIINKDSRDPFKYERKIKYENNLYNPSFNNEGDDDKSKLVLLYNYDEYNKFKRKSNSTCEDMINNSSAKKNNRYTEEERMNVNQELNTYKNMIENMQNEIVKLNYKLNELDNKNNSFVNIPKIESLEKNIDLMKNQIDHNMKVKEDRLFKLEKDKEYLLLKNQEIEKELNRLDLILYRNESVKSGHVNKLSADLKKPNSTRSNSKDTRNIKVVQKMKSKSPNIKKRRDLSLRRVKNENNENLEKKIKKLERIIMNLNEQLNLEKNDKKGKDNNRSELQIWKNRTEMVSKNYADNLKNMKKQLFIDKENYNEQIKIIQGNFVNQVNILKNQYQSIIEKNEKTIKNMKKENCILKNRVMKVKDILIIEK